MSVARPFRILSIHGWRLALCAFAMGAGACACFANVPGTYADYPVKPIRIIVASSVGAADDFFARLLADELETIYQRRVLIENRPGAGGLIGNKRMSQARADGYTLGMI